MEGKIINECKIGNATVKINDAYIIKDPGRIDEILKRIAAIGVNALSKKGG